MQFTLTEIVSMSSDYHLLVCRMDEVNNLDILIMELLWVISNDVSNTVNGIWKRTLIQSNLSIEGHFHYMDGAAYGPN